jgi:hypothetical protein
MLLVPVRINKGTQHNLIGTVGIGPPGHNRLLKTGPFLTGLAVELSNIIAVLDLHAI